MRLKILLLVIFNLLMVKLPVSSLEQSETNGNVNFPSSPVEQTAKMGAYQIFDLSFLGKYIELQDGTIWKVKPRDRSAVANLWRANDWVTLTPSSLPKCSGFSFYMTNERIKSSIYVNLASYDRERKMHSLKISYIDAASGDIILKNATGDEYFFQVPFPSRAFIYDWYVDHLIVIGINDHWMLNIWDSSEFVLYNIKRMRYVKATQH